MFVVSFLRLSRPWSLVVFDFLSATFLISRESGPCEADVTGNREAKKLGKKG